MGEKSVNVEMNPVNISAEEMNELVKKLPDWGKEVRKMMAKKYEGYKYWVDGVRVDGKVCLLKKVADRQWFLTYFHYRICGKDKATRFKSVLQEAYMVDSVGRIGKYENEMDINGDYIDGYKVTFRPGDGCERVWWIEKEKAIVRMPVDKEEVIGVLKYSNLDNDWGKTDYWRNYSMEMFALRCAVYIHFPQVEFIYKMEKELVTVDIINLLITLYKSGEYQKIKDWINVIRLCMKHKFYLFDDITESGMQKWTYYRTRYGYDSSMSLWRQYGLWKDYIEGLMRMGKDCSNPHYICPDNIVMAHDKVMHTLQIKFPEPVSERVQKKFNRLKKRFVGLEFEEDDLIIQTLDSPQAYIEEAKAMHNCIAALEYYIKPSSLILCARRNDKRLADIELSLVDYTIRQCCGPCNARVDQSDRKQIEALIEKNLPIIIDRQFPRKKKIPIDSVA